MQQRLVQTGRPVTLAPRGMVAAPHYLAAEAGVWALQQGGNAVDAAVTTNAVLGVVYPHMAGLGGDAFFMIWQPGRNLPICLNGSGHSGYRATSGFYRDRGHNIIPAHGLLAVNTVPGAVAAWADVHSRWGALPWEQILEPAIHYAESGFPVTANLACWLEREQQTLSHYDDTRTLLFRDGQVYGEGETLVQRNLAQTLRVLAGDGAGAFYCGELSDAIKSYLAAHGGLLTGEDLQGHHSDWTGPLRTVYRGRTIYEMPPNTQGLAAILTFNLLAGFDLQAMSDQGAPYYHTLVEVAKAVHAGLDGRLADPNFAALPLESMLAPDYIEQQRALILPDHARREADYAAGIQQPEMTCPPPMPAGATAYVATVDESGLAVSLIQSLHSPFGSGVIAGDTGVLLHNSGAAFSLEAHSPNRLEPHKRPAQPLIPAMVFEEERPWMILGASGGEVEPQIHAALVTRAVDMGYNIQQAIEAPRWLYRPPESSGMGTLYIEGRVPDSVLRQLREMGHEVKVVGDWSDMMGQAQGIIVDAESRVFRGGADPRGDGQAIGW